MPWAGITKIKSKNLKTTRDILENALAETIKGDMGDEFIPTRFIPYIQFHETESLLFADPGEMAEVFGRPALKEMFEKIVEECGGCEKINNNYDTAPSRRITKLFHGYKKGSSVNAHAYRIAQHIGVQKIRKQCPNFDEWYGKLERLGE
jgi:hypothetical protein